ncbi:MAG: hypothetical protein QM612_07530 [Thermomonas sp.]|uniref:hypothetical protein n=1 Tax=Thermomonas sp. TaxID=1971895 RepID=UPI0039E3703C
MNPMRWAVLALLTCLLAACAAGGPLVKPGRTTAGSDLSIEAGMEWTRMGGTREQLWTIDGPLLNSLYLIPTVREREFVFLGQRQTKRRPDGAFYHRGMRADELRDLIADGMRAIGAVNIETLNLRPVDFGGREGLRFEMTMDNEAGLKYRAMAAAFEHEKGLALALFYAPAEYYYPRDEAKVSAMLDTLRWK